MLTELLMMTIGSSAPGKLEPLRNMFEVFRNVHRNSLFPCQAGTGRSQRNSETQQKAQTQKKSFPRDILFKINVV